MSVESVESLVGAEEGAPAPHDGRGTETVRLGWRQWASRYGLLVGLVALIALFGVLRPDSFFTLDNLRPAVTASAPLLVLAVGLTVPLSMSEFDLSVSAGTRCGAC